MLINNISWVFYYYHKGMVYFASNFFSEIYFKIYNQLLNSDQNKLLKSLCYFDAGLAILLDYSKIFIEKIVYYSLKHLVFKGTAFLVFILYPYALSVLPTDCVFPDFDLGVCGVCDFVHAWASLVTHDCLPTCNPIKRVSRPGTNVKYLFTTSGSVMLL